MKYNFLLCLLCAFSVASRFNPSPNSVPVHPRSGSDLPTASRLSPSLNNTSALDLVCSNWSPTWRLDRLRPTNRSPRSSLLASCLLLLSGDVEANPGPGPRYPCGSCSKGVRSSQQGIFCEVCYYWFHTKCIDMPLQEYTRLSTSDEGWCCQRCYREAFPFFDTSTLSSSAADAYLTHDSPTSPSGGHDPVGSISSSMLTVVSANCRSLISNLDAVRGTNAGTSTFVMVDSFLM